MVRGMAKIAAASGLAAAAATPFTLGTLADTSPVSGAVGSVQSQVSGAATPVTSNIQALPITAPAPVAGVAPATVNDPAPALDPPAQAPPGTASANAVSIAPLDTCISCTDATAGPNGGVADAIALRVLGHDLSAGSASGNGSQSGNLIAVPANPLLNLAIADWMASAQSSATSSSAASRAALVDLNLGNGQIATLAVLEAGSNAAWNGSSSSGSAYTNGVNLNVGNGALAVILLHSDANSTGASHAYVASINGVPILSSDQLPQPITITIPGVATITLLQTNATGGFAVGSVGSASNLLNMPGQQLGLFQSTGQGSGNAGPAASTDTGVQVANTSSDFGSPGVPETGMALGILGFLLAAGGAVAAASSRVTRRKQAAA